MVVWCKRNAKKVQVFQFFEILTKWNACPTLDITHILKMKERNETSDFVASNLSWLVSYEVSEYDLWSQNLMCHTSKVTDISFLLYWTRNFVWACLSSVRTYKVQCSKFCNLLALHRREHRKGLAIYKVPEHSKKKLAFLCLCVKTHCMCNFEHSFLPHLRFKRHICFSTTLIWMHSTHPASFGFNEEWLVDQILQNKTEDFGGCLSRLHQLHTQWWKISISQWNSKFFLPKVSTWNPFQLHGVWVLK
jgi:hypothetical protein